MRILELFKNKKKEPKDNELQDNKLSDDNYYYCKTDDEAMNMIYNVEDAVALPYYEVENIKMMHNNSAIAFIMQIQRMYCISYPKFITISISMEDIENLIELIRTYKKEDKEDDKSANSNDD